MVKEDNIFNHRFANPSIVHSIIVLIDSLGFEEFTFKKLGLEIGYPESTVHRYFENKHKILLYLTMWYWSWLEYRLVFSTINIYSPEERLDTAIKLLVDQSKKPTIFHILIK